MGTITVLIIQLLIAYWLYSDARKTGLPQMRILLWTLAAVMIPLPFCLLVVAAYFFVGKRGYITPQQQDNTIDVQAEVLPDKELDAGATVKEPVKYCRMCGAGLAENQNTCPKCNTAN